MVYDVQRASETLQDSPASGLGITVSLSSLLALLSISSFASLYFPSTLSSSTSYLSTYKYR